MARSRSWDVDGGIRSDQVATPVVDAGREGLIRGVVERDSPEEAEVGHRLLQRLAPEPIADLGEGGVDRVDQRLAERVVAPGAPVEVAQRGAARFDAVRAGELLVHLHRTRVERRGGDHDLEGRSGWVEALCGAIQERGLGGVERRGEAVVGIERRRRRHHEDLPGTRIQGHHRAAARKALEFGHRDPLGGGVQSEHDVVAAHGRSAKTVERVANARQIRRRSRKFGIEGLLETRPSREEAGVADVLGGETALRIAPEEHVAPVECARDALGEDDTVRADDGAAIDRQIPVDQSDVRLARFERRLRPYLPVPRHPDQGDQPDGEDPEQTADASVHVRSRLARWEMHRRSAMIAKFAVTLDPP